MAHSCPECDQVCHCNGDIDDCILDGTQAQKNCVHYLQCEEIYKYDDFDDDDFFATGYES